jgi:cytosine deaminase
MSVAVQAGKIVQVVEGLQAGAQAAETVDAQGYLLSPHFVDAHFHMDATLSYGLPRVNDSGTLLEGMRCGASSNPSSTPTTSSSAPCTYCDWAVAKGLLAIRSHVDTSDPSLLPVQALLEVKQRVAGYLDLQLVAFPQDGVLRTQGGWTT